MAEIHAPLPTAYAIGIQPCTVKTVAVTPGTWAYSLAVTAGQGKGQEYQLAVDRQVPISPAKTFNGTLDCPTGAVGAEP